ncbi:MAG: diacylglycerol/lipid kinase family protein [Faecalimonas sp.]
MYIFIVNPASRSGHASQIWTEIETLLKERNIEYRVYFTSHRGHGTKLAQQLTKDLSSRTTLIVVGGDGTVNEVLNGIEHPEHIILGYIPNSVPEMILVKECLPIGSTQKALNWILSPKQLPNHIDIGVLKYSEKDTEKIRKFAVSTGIGFDAAICHQALVSRLKVLLNRIHLGKLSYAFISLRELALHKPCCCCIFRF